MPPPAGTESTNAGDGGLGVGVGGAVTSGIRNLESLLTHGRSRPRALALRAVAAGLAACDPALAVERTVTLDGDVLGVGGAEHRLHPEGRLVVLGSGKASVAIAAALESALGARLEGGLVVARDDSGPALSRVRQVEAGHPIPDARSHDAARAQLEIAAGLGEHDLLLACFTGGCSALTSLPPPAVPDADKQALHRSLLASGMPIGEINVVRKQVSSFKGGRLALAAQPAEIINLTVSDVAGDALDAITDPTVPNDSSAADAIAVLGDWGLWEEVPPSIRDHLLAQPGTGVELDFDRIQTEVLITGEEVCAAMSAEVALAGSTPVILGTGIEGEARAVGAVLGQIAAEIARLGRPISAPSVLLVCGGESTVRLADAEQFGRGGPNREAALAAAARIAGCEVAAAFVDTDGADGGGEVAGAVADGDTSERAAAAGVDIRAALANHSSGATVGALGDAIETGPTHTNVNDLFAIAIGGPGDG